MNYMEIRPFDTANGEGVRVSLFVAGCKHHCEGCFNRESWKFNAGKVFTYANLYGIIKLDAWMIYTREKFGERSLCALATMVKNVTFVIHESDKFGDFYRIQNIREGITPIGITEEELHKFCIKL